MNAETLKSINYDSTPITNSSIADIDIEKVDHYIQLTTGQKIEDFPIPSKICS